MSLEEKPLESEQTNQGVTPQEAEPAQANREDDSPEDFILKQMDARFGAEPAPKVDKPEEVQTQDSEKPQDDKPVERKHKFKAADRELEVTEAELYELASKGVDYTRKTQALQQQWADVGTARHLWERAQSDPAFAQYLMAYGQPQAQPQAKQAPANDDPVAQFEAEVAAKVLQQLAPALAPVQELKQQQAVTSFLGQLQARDGEDFQAAYQGVGQYIQGLAPGVREATVSQIDRDPQAFMALYDHLLTDYRAWKASRPKGDAKQPAANAGTAERPQSVPLESPGATVDSAPSKNREQEIAKLAKRIKNNQASSEDKDKYFRLRMGG